MSAPIVTVLSLAVALVMTPLAMRAAQRLGILDRPGELKGQAQPVPYLGGVAVFAGVAVGVLSARPSVMVPLALALVLGVADDRLDLSPWIRLVGQVAIGATVAATCPVRLSGWAALVLTVVVTVVLVNGMNLLDGLDMLATGVAASSAVGFALVLVGPGRVVALSLAAALLGFLAFNRPPARIYLGDGGSYLLGTALTALLALSWAPHTTAVVGTACLLLVVVPAAELALAVLRRLRSRRSVMAGDRRHPYDCLVARGWSPTWASLSYTGVGTVLAVGAVVAAHRSSLATVILVDLVGVALVLTLALASGTLATTEEASP